MEEGNMNNKNGSKNLVFNSKSKVVLTVVISAVIFILVVFVMVMESKDGQLIIKNNTDLNLNYVKAKFVYSDGDVNEGIQAKDIKAGNTYKKAMDPINLTNIKANYEIRFQFDGYDELLTDCGLFNETFEGNIKVTFDKTEDPNLIKLKVKANNGILPSKLTQCNDEFTINLKEGKVIE
jgi:hypothetical protein